MKTYTRLDDEQLIAELNSGAVGIMPTDTLYGIVCSAGSRQSAERLHQVKQRDGKPGTIIAADIGQLEALGLKRRYLTPVQQFWPGAVSVIIPCGSELEYLHLGKGGLAVRIPADEQLRALLSQTGPLLTSSANLTGQPPAVTIAQAQYYFGDTVDFYVDGGDLSGNLPSTIIRVVDDEIELIRPGAVNINL